MIYFQIFTTFRYKSLKNSEYNAVIPYAELEGILMDDIKKRLY